MRFQGEGLLVRIDSIDQPAGFAERLKAPHVAELAKSIKLLGGEPLAPLLVDATQENGKWQVIAGRDRLAACRLARVEHVPVRLVEGCTDVELFRLEIAENLFRRPVNDRGALLEAYLNGREAEIAVEREAPDASARAWAERFERERVAREADPEWQKRAAALAANTASVPDLGALGAAVEPVPSDAPSSVTPVTEAPPVAHRPESPRGQAIRELAAATGRSVGAIKMELSRHEAKAKVRAPKDTGHADALAALGRATKNVCRLAGQVGDQSIVRAADELARVVKARMLVQELAGLPAENKALVECLAVPPSGPADEEELPDEPAWVPEPPPGFFDGADGLEPDESFEALSDEVLP